MYLRSLPAWVVGDARKAVFFTAGSEHATQVEVSHLDSPVLVDQEVGGLEVTMQDGWLVVVQLNHALQTSELASRHIL